MATEDRTNKIDITIHWERCLRARSVKSECSLCVDTCPGRAISLAGRMSVPALDVSRCMQCGQCLTACPLEAFESDSFTERQLVNRIGDDEKVRIRCFLPFGHLDSLGQDVPTYQLGTCLAALSPGVLFELALEKRRELYTDCCAQCRLFEHLRPTFEENVRGAFRMLHGVRASANLTESTPLFLPQTQAGGAAEVDNRGTLRARISSLFAGSSRVSNVLDNRTVLAVRQRSKHVPLWRHRIQELWAQHSLSASGVCDYAWPELIVDEGKCRACGVCMQMCPTGTILHTMDNGVFICSFVPGTCVDCGLCMVVCPQGALSRNHRPFPHPFLSVDRYRRRAGICEKCGMPVLEGLGDSLCPSCAKVAARPSLESRIRAQLGIKAPSERGAS